MERFRWIEAKGNKFLYIDFSNLKPDELVKEVEKGIEFIKGLGEKEILMISDTSNSPTNPKSFAAVKRFGNETNAYVKRSATIGAKGIKRFSFRIYKIFIKRDIEAVDSIEEAIEWLSRD
ncbi:MAG: hypothetical protein JRJ39_08580 [Deltaproteobacteria bacterium]|nr:hypothetical protein [Deltaproteobacteria bacterium]MBW1846514.1 hypothetical protein [Deltaproteobacteria bacterium]MBW2179871.1 hypothetical protein [Deltaproteobacteria bacterium]